MPPGPVSVPLLKYCAAKPITGRPLYVAVVAVNDDPVLVLVWIVAPPMSWWTGGVTPPNRFRSTQPFGKFTGMFNSVGDSSTFVLLNVTTCASKHSELVTVGGGGENEPRTDCSSRL